MPSRPVTFAIVAFWLFTAGWFVVRDLVPAWRSGEPPPYTIEMADEAQPQVVKTRWSCTLNGQSIGKELFTVFGPSKPGDHKKEPFALFDPPKLDDDTFELSATCKELTLPVVGQIKLLLQDYEDRVRVDRDGELRSTHTSGNWEIRGIELPLKGRFELSAEVRHGRVERHLMLDAGAFGKYVPELAPTDPPHGSILNPTHPVPRIGGLRPGQTWQQPLVDPRAETLRAVWEQTPLGKLISLPRRPETLLAVVLSEPQSLRWENQDQPCLVIEFRDGEDYVARTWVRQSDGLVLRQEAGGHGEKLVLQRE